MMLTALLNIWHFIVVDEGYTLNVFYNLGGALSDHNVQFFMIRGTQWDFLIVEV